MSVLVIYTGGTIGMVQLEGGGLAPFSMEGRKPPELLDEAALAAALNPPPPEVEEPDYENVVGQDSVNRFDRPRGGGKGNRDSAAARSRKRPAARR